MEEIKITLTEEECSTILGAINTSPIDAWSGTDELHDKIVKELSDQTNLERILY